MSKKQGFVGSLRKGEKEFAKRNPVQNAQMGINALNSLIELNQDHGWDTDDLEAKLVKAEKKLEEVIASGVEDTDYDKDGNLKRRL